MATDDGTVELEEIRQKKLNELVQRFSGEKNTKKEGESVTTKIDTNDSNFNEQVIEQSGKVPVVVDFWATWCAPCVMLGPVLEKVATEHGGRFILAKLNVDENPTVSRKYGIMSIPSVKMFKDGKVIDEFVGAIPESRVRSWIEKNVGKK